MQGRIRLHVVASNPFAKAAIERASEGYFQIASDYAPGVVQVLYDDPLLYALERLEALPEAQLPSTAVSTSATHPVYLDCLASYGPSGVFLATDETAALRAIQAAHLGITSYRMTSGLSPNQLRVVRLLLRGWRTDEIAAQLGITTKTVNSHISNVLGQLGYKDRAQLVAKVLGSYPRRDG